MVRCSLLLLKLFECLGRRESAEWVFPSSRKDGPLSRQAIAERMRHWGQEAEVHLHPHKLRHTHATHAIRRVAADPAFLQELKARALHYLASHSQAGD